MIQFSTVLEQAPVLNTRPLAIAPLGCFSASRPFKLNAKLQDVVILDSAHPGTSAGRCATVWPLAAADVSDAPRRDDEIHAADNRHATRHKPGRASQQSRELLLTHGRPFWGLVNRHAWLSRIVNRVIVNNAVGKAPFRPLRPEHHGRLRLSWSSLTDRTWFSRYLPPKDMGNLPPLDALGQLYVQRPGGPRLLISPHCSSPPSRSGSPTAS